MAKGGLALKSGTIGLAAGVTIAALVAFVEALNACLGILYDRFQVDVRGMMGQSGGPGAAIGLFFDQLRTEFDTLAHLTRMPLPGAEMSLIFAGAAILTAYVWIERAKRYTISGIDPLPIIVLVVAALPVLVCVVDLTVA